MSNAFDAFLRGAAAGQQQKMNRLKMAQIEKLAPLEQRLKELQIQTSEANINLAKSQDQRAGERHRFEVDELLPAQAASLSQQVAESANRIRVANSAEARAQAQSDQDIMINNYNHAVKQVIDPLVYQSQILETQTAEQANKDANLFKQHSVLTDMKNIPKDQRAAFAQGAFASAGVDPEQSGIDLNQLGDDNYLAQLTSGTLSAIPAEARNLLAQGDRTAGLTAIDQSSEARQAQSHNLNQKIAEYKLNQDKLRDPLVIENLSKTNEQLAQTIAHTDNKEVRDAAMFALDFNRGEWEQGQNELLADINKTSLELNNQLTAQQIEQRGDLHPANVEALQAQNRLANQQFRQKAQLFGTQLDQALENVNLTKEQRAQIKAATDKLTQDTLFAEQGQPTAIAQAQADLAQTRQATATSEQQAAYTKVLAAKSIEELRQMKTPAVKTGTFKTTELKNGNVLITNTTTGDTETIDLSQDAERPAGISDDAWANWKHLTPADRSAHVKKMLDPQVQAQMEDRVKTKAKQGQVQKHALDIINRHLGHGEELNEILGRFESTAAADFITTWADG